MKGERIIRSLFLPQKYLTGSTEPRRVMDMATLFKILLTVAVVFLCVHVGKKSPSLAGLLATMPLAGLLTMVWLYTDTAGNPRLMEGYARGALWGTVPACLFYIVAFLCFRKGLSLPATLAAGFGVWLIGAAAHQWFTK